VPNPANPQCFNRYSYCLNNPLRYTDPTGYWNWGLFGVGVGLCLVGAAVVAIFFVAAPIAVPVIAAAIAAEPFIVLDVTIVCGSAVGAPALVSLMGVGIAVVGALAPADSSTPKDSSTPQLPVSPSKPVPTTPPEPANPPANNIVCSVFTAGGKCVDLTASQLATLDPSIPYGEIVCSVFTAGGRCVDLTAAELATLDPSIPYGEQV
jgi:hypothetical protein